MKKIGQRWKHYESIEYILVIVFELVALQMHAEKKNNHKIAHVTMK